MTMHKTFYRVIIADSSGPRAEFLARELWSCYGASPETVESWEDLSERLRASERQSIRLVIISQDLPGGGGAPCKRASAVLGLLPQAHVILVVQNPRFAVPPQTSLHLLATTARDQWHLNQTEIDRVLALCRLPAPDQILRQMIRSIDNEGDLQRGTDILNELAAKLWTSPAPRFSRLTQGYSGAKVFRVDFLAGGNQESYAIKVTARRDFWKLQNELDKWQEIEGALDLRGLRRFIPHLHVPAQREMPHGLWVSTNDLHAVAYQFLGADLGRFLSLSDAYLFSTASLAQMTQSVPCGSRISSLGELVVAEVLLRLRKAWYSKATIASDTILWGLTEPQRGTTVGVQPPYTLSAWQRAHILGALESFEKVSRLGPRLLKNTWRQDCQDVSNWLVSGPPSGTRLNNRLPVVMSPVHGDLNSSNILFWVDESQPFLIDFACYQSSGHTMQDFARLETEVKYALMDRESDSPLRALDLTETQLDIWCLAEDRLASERWEEMPNLRKNSRLTKRAVKLIQYIRGEGSQVQREAFSRSGEQPGDFLTEYFAALLYHTLRTIGYESLSPFKRLLAVYSAARLIRSLKAT